MSAQTIVDFSVDSRWIIPVENKKNEEFFEKYKNYFKKINGHKAVQGNYSSKRNAAVNEDDKKEEHFNPTKNTEENKKLFETEKKTTILHKHTIGIKGQNIFAILPTDIFYQFFETKKRFDFSQKSTVLIPGLINCHIHMGMTILRGCVDDVPLQTFLEERIWPIESKFVNEEFVRISTQLAAYELLKSGVTMVNDMYYLHEVSEKVCEEANLRIVTGRALIAHDETHAKLLNQAIDTVIRDVAEEKGEERQFVRRSFVAHSLYTLEEKHLRRLKEESRKKRVVQHMHLNETKNEVNDFIIKYNMSPVDALDKIGFLDENLVAAHCVWMTGEEIKKFAERRASVCHCPRSNMKLGSGICNVKRMLEEGVNVCLGTDSACTNNSLSILDEMSIACLITKGINMDSTAVTCYEALQMATINGAKALNRHHDLGSLEVGKLCDMVLIDLDDIANFPVYDPLSHLVYTTTNNKVLNTWVGGRLVVEGGEVLTVKPNLEEAGELAEKIKDFIKCMYTSKMKQNE